MNYEFYFYLNFSVLTTWAAGIYDYDWLQTGRY